MTLNLQDYDVFMIAGEIDFDITAKLYNYLEKPVNKPKVLVISSPGGLIDGAEAIKNILGTHSTKIDKVIANAECSSAAFELFITFPIEKRLAYQGTYFVAHSGYMEHLDNADEATLVEYQKYITKFNEKTAKLMANPKLPLQKARDIIKEGTMRSVPFIIKHGLLLKENVIKLNKF